MSATTPPAEAPAPGNKKRLVLVGLVFALVAGGFYWFQFRGGDAEAKPEPGEVLMLDPVHINLSGGGYLKVGLALQFSAEAAGHGTPNGAHALDLTIDEFSHANPSDIANKRQAMKKKLEKKIIDAYHHDVLAVYYTEYVTQ